MKNYKYIQGALLMWMVFLVSCVDFVEPNIPYKDFNTGAYLRTIARTSTSFNFFDLTGARFALTLEAVDAENGATVETVEIRVRHRRLIPGVGLAYVPVQPSGGEWTDILIHTLTAADFAPNTESRFLRASFDIPASVAMEALGLTSEDIEGGDTFEFRLVLTDRMGRVFSNHNRSADVEGGLFYASPFQYNVGVVCPSDLGGTYRTTVVQASGPIGACPANVPGEITFIPREDGISYEVSDGTFGYWGCINDDWGTGAVVLNDACGALSISGTDKYGDSYSMTVLSSSSTQLTIEWVNTYNEGGTVIIFANEDAPFPDGLR
ncbi:hypothetical protein [Anditalea andensis]|uniref:DUF1735 domain-containing protein n=1 Tax=Anditalea andensis TaxID=1048983 RepID=A0A074KRB4_9BACT|nr:hypothetical protein [Anditalea andensis]KEO72491.1 hypothetical protein EL17_17285 [Anditalea andensis]